MTLNYAHNPDNVVGSCTGAELVGTAPYDDRRLFWYAPNIPKSTTCHLTVDLSSADPRVPLAYFFQIKAIRGDSSVIESRAINLYYRAQSPPTVDVTANTVGSPLKYQFVADAQSTSGGTVSSYDWNFDDGTTGTGRTPTHTYAKAGKYHVTVKVTDSNDQQTTVGRDLQVGGGLVVNSVADTANASGSGTACDTGATVGTPAVPECTLRAAIQAANTAATAQDITFAIPGAGEPVIAVASALPRATAPVSIDGTSQPGGWVGLNGADASFDGLDLRGGNSSVKGLVIGGFRFATVLAIKGRDTVSGNRFGVDSAGTGVTTVPSSAVVINTGATDSTVTDNVISATGAAVQAISGSTGTITGNRIGVRSDGTATLGPLPAGGVQLRDVGAFTVENNTISAQTFGVQLRGNSNPGTSITGNHIGTTSTGSARLESSGFGIIVDAVPGATVARNVVSVSRGPYDLSADVMVTGSAQCTSTGCNSPDTAVSGPVTGGGTTVRANSLGVLADGTGSDAGGSYGVLAFAKAPDLSVKTNVIAGHFAPRKQVAEIELEGTTDATVAHNILGLNAAGTAVVRADVDVDVVGATGTTIDDNLIGGASTAGVQVRSSSGGAASSDTSLADNSIGVNLSATAALANVVGVMVADDSSDTTIGPHNLVSGNTEAGIRVSGQATGTNLVDDAIGPNATGSNAIPNGIGVDVSEAANKTTVVGSLIAGNTTAGIRTTSTGIVAVTKSQIGRHDARGTLANGVGIDARGPMTLISDTIRANLGAGLVSEARRFVYVSDDTTFADNGGVGIVSPGYPGAPTIEAVLTTTASSKPRLRLVITAVGGPRALGTISVYANPDCSHPGSATTPIPFNVKYNNASTTLIVAPKSTTIAGGYTATVSLLAQPAGSKVGIDKPFGRTSAISTCVVPHAYPDTSGTGIPDVIQKALGGDPADPRSVSFLGADSEIVRLTASQGRLTDVVDAADTPALPAGVTLPSGPFSFKVAGVGVGSPVDVVVSHATQGSYQPEYWRYGRPTAAAQPQWYRWDYNPTTHLGVRASSDGEVFVLHFIDGSDGDDDAAANGTIVDPGAPAVDTRSAPHPSVPRPSVSAPAFTPSASATEGLPATGDDTVGQLWNAAMLLLVGAGALFAGRQRRGRL